MRLPGWLRWPARGGGMPPSLPADWRGRLEARVPLFARLPEPLRARLEAPLARFVAEVPFVGCAGLAVDDDMRLAIASQACILALGLDGAPYARLHGVMVYPDEFVVEESEEDEATGVVTEGHRALSGQTIETDRVVLSWRDVAESLRLGDGYNVVVHEFAHYLDHAWANRPVGSHDALRAGYAALCDAVERGQETLIDPYGAKDEAEFFAVLAEVFLELPQDLADEHPELYAFMSSALRLDPVAWGDPGDAAPAPAPAAGHPR
jgi:Mlc titration factor MtfA (ptsG expression regulator)